MEDLLKGEEPNAITFERIHGRGSNMIQARDLNLHNFAPRDFPAVVPDGLAWEELPAEPERVLLTGANGFLGRFLLLDFLKRVSTKCVPVPSSSRLLSTQVLLSLSKECQDADKMMEEPQA